MGINMKKSKKNKKPAEKERRLHAEMPPHPAAWITNPTVQADSETETGVPIPNTQNVEYSKEYGEENEL